MAGGCIVEGNWFALAVCMTAHRYCQSSTVLWLLWFMASLVVLGLFINANQWALAVLPVILIALHAPILECEKCSGPLCQDSLLPNLRW